MAAFRPRFSRHTAVAGLALLAALVATTRAWSQGHTPDPYNFVGEYNRGYEPYMFPAYPNDQGVIPGQAALQGRSGLRQANQYRNFVEELDGVDARDDVFAPTRGFRSGAGVPYYQAYRQYDRDYLRYYAPNQTADQTYYENQKARHDKHLQYQEAAREKYAQYVREADPTRAPGFTANTSTWTSGRTSRWGRAAARPHRRAGPPPLPRRSLFPRPPTLDPGRQRRAGRSERA